jgi:hypothetical protein
MTLGTTVVSQPLRVLPDPRGGGTLADEREHATMVRTLAQMSADLTRTLGDLRDVRTQAKSLAGREPAPAGAAQDALRSLAARVDSLESIVVTSGLDGGGLAIMSNSPRLDTDVSGLLSAVEGSSAPVTSGEREQFARLRQRSSALLAGAERVLTVDLDRTNAALKSAGLGNAIMRRSHAGAVRP